MKSLVIYDSFFGNTRKIGEAIAQGLGADTIAVAVKEVTPDHLTGIDVLIVGSPTRAFSATKPTNQFIKKLAPCRLKGIKIAGFDTRMDIKDVNNKFLTFMAGIFGYAAEPITALLKKKGGTQALAPGGFIVNGEQGPLRQGELERAKQWAQDLLK